MAHGGPGDPAAEESSPALPTRDDWKGLVVGKRPDAAEKRLSAPLMQSTQGGSGTFLGLCSDGGRFWIKPLNSPQGATVAVTEQVVARAGRLIQAAVCEVATIEIPSGLAGWEFRPKHKLEPGIAHGSAEIPGTVDEKKGDKSLRFRSHDSNASRQATYFALYDWCWGSDIQCLIALDDDRKYYSHDHGHFFPGGPKWKAQALLDHVDEPHELNHSTAGLDFVTVENVAHALHNLERSDILAIVTSIPHSWPVGDEHLETVGYFLERRASLVAARLLTRFGGTA